MSRGDAAAATRTFREDRPQVPPRANGRPRRRRQRSAQLPRRRRGRDAKTPRGDPRGVRGGSRKALRGPFGLVSTGDGAADPRGAAVARRDGGGGRRAAAARARGRARFCRRVRFYNAGRGAGRRAFVGRDDGRPRGRPARSSPVGSGPASNVARRPAPLEDLQTPAPRRRRRCRSRARACRRSCCPSARTGRRVCRFRSSSSAGPVRTSSCSSSPRGSRRRRSRRPRPRARVRSPGTPTRKSGPRTRRGKSSRASGGAGSGRKITYSGSV